MLENLIPQEVRWTSEKFRPEVDSSAISQSGAKRYALKPGIRPLTSGVEFREQFGCKKGRSGLRFRTVNTNVI